MGDIPDLRIHALPLLSLAEQSRLLPILEDHTLVGCTPLGRILVGRTRLERILAGRILAGRILAGRILPAQDPAVVPVPWPEGSPSVGLNSGFQLPPPFRSTRLCRDLPTLSLCLSREVMGELFLHSYNNNRESYYTSTSTRVATFFSRDQKRAHLKRYLFITGILIKFLD